MNKKYEFTEETIKTLDGHILHRIRSLKDFGNVHIGDLGGFIGKEENLSHDGNAWVYDDARVYGNALISGNAQIFGNAWVYDDAMVSGNALISGNAQIFGNAWISGNAHVFEDARVYDNAWVFKNARVYGDVKVSGDARVYRDAKVFNSSVINGFSCIGKSAIIGNNDDFYTICKFKSSNGTAATFYKTKDSIYVSCGYFNDSIEEFEQRVKKVHSDTKYDKHFLDDIMFAKTLLTKDN